MPAHSASHYVNVSLGRAWFADPVVWLGAAFGSAATAYALFADRYLPYIDWGAHLGLISVLAHGGSTGALAFFERSFAPSPYLLFYLLTAIFAQVVSVDVAAKIVMVLAGGALTLALAAFAGASGRNPRLGLIGPLGLFNISLGWGFGSFIVATPLFFFVMAAFERLLFTFDQGRPRRDLLRATASASVQLVLLYLAHGFLFVCGAAILAVRAGVHAIARRSASPIRALAFSMVLPALTVLPAAVNLIRRPTIEAGTERNQSLLELRPLSDHIAGYWRDTLELGSVQHVQVMKLALAILGLWIMYSLVRRQRTPMSRAPEIVALAASALYLFGPMSVNWPSSIWLVYPRFGIIATLSMFVLPACDLSGILGTAMALSALFPIAWNARINAEHIRTFSGWAHGYDEVRKLIPPGSRVLPLTVPGPGEPPLPHHAIGSLYTYLMVDGAAYVAFLFDKPELPVHYRHDVVVRAPYWQTPWYFDPRTHGIDYDYLVLRGRDLVRRTEDAGLHVLVKNVGDWWVYKTKAPRTVAELSGRGHKAGDLQ